jgi:hypothetical protein
MGKNATSFAIIVGGSGDGSIQAAKRQWWLIATQGHLAQWAGSIE